MATIDRVASTVKAAVKKGMLVKVDGHRVRGARTKDGELEVDWWRDEPEPLSTTVQPNLMTEVDGVLIIETD